VSRKIVPASVNRILVAFDGSEPSWKAVELAIDMASKWNAELNFVHVLEEKDVPEGFKKFAEIEHMEPADYFSFVKNECFSKIKSRAKKAGIEDVECIVVRGDPADEILSRAKDLDVDMIVMGSRGLGRFSQVFMGSVSTKVCNHAFCTCITVK
jgi:nucleotide-binding universal stress UspA family protein